MIISTHIVEDLSPLAPALAIMDKGEILFAGTLDQLSIRTGETASLEDAYLTLLKGR